MNAVSEYLAEGAPTKELLDTSIKRGQELLAAMTGKDFSNARAKVVTEREAARKLVNTVKEWAKPINDFKDDVNKTMRMLTKFERNLEDLHNQTVAADAMASEAIAGNWRTTPQAQTKIARWVKLIFRVVMILYELCGILFHNIHKCKALKFN